MIGLRRALLALAVAWICGVSGCSEEQPRESVDVAVSVSALAPVNGLPPPQTTNEDSQLTFSSFGGNAITVDDADNTTSTVQITVTNGVFNVGPTVSGITVTGNGTSSVILSGPIEIYTIVGMAETLTGGINRALDGARYTPNANFNGAASLQMNSSDTNGEVGFNILDITVTSFNDSPVNNVPAGVQAATEDVPQAFTLSVSDVDAGNAPIVITLASSNNTLITLPTTAGLTFSSGDGTSDASLGFSGTLSDISAALNGLTVTPPANYIGPSTLVMTSNDQGASGAGAAGSDSDTVNITWAAVNDPPVNSLPLVTQATVEEGAVTFSSANGNALSVNDADGPSTQVQVTLSATSGTITLGAPGGVTFTAGDGTADTTMTFRGTLFSLNTAMANTVFQPSQDFAGTAVLTMISNDLGNIGTGGARLDTDTVNITVAGVNDAPVNSVPGGQITAEDVLEVFSAGNGSLITFADPDAATLQVTLTAQNGVVTLGSVTGLTFQAGDGTADAVTTFTGTIAQVNSAVATLSFRPTLNFSGEASLTIETSDRGASGTGGTLIDEDEITIEVVPGNDPPDAVNDTLTVAEDAALTPVAVLGNDTAAPDVGETLTITAVSTPLHGTAVIDGSQVSYQPAANYAGADSFTYTISDGNGGTDTASVAITVSSVNDAPTAQDDSFTALQAVATSLNVLSNDSSAPDSGETLTITMVSMPAHGTATISSGTSISYTSSAGYAGSDAFTYTISDGAGGTSTADVAISVQAVNTKPVNTLPGPQTVSEDSQLTFSSGSGNAITVADSNNSTLTVQVTVTNGTFTLGSATSLTVTGNGTASVTAQGTLAALNNGFNNARYTPSASYNGAATLTMNSSDSNGESDLDVLTLSVTSINDAPVNTVPGAAQVAVEDVPLTFGTISVSDADVGSGQLRVTLTSDNGTQVTLSSLAGLSFSAGDGTNDTTMTFSGALPSINTALNGLTVTSTSNYIGGSTLTITTNDLGNSGVGGAGQDSDVVAITWGSVNDPPVNTVPGAQAAEEETPFTFALASSNALRVSDLDVSGGLMQITLSVTSGTLSLGATGGLTFSSGDGTADASMAFSGTLANVNSALEGTVFTPSANFAGTATLTLVASDLGNSGTGGAKTDTDTVAIHVGGRNDAPVNTVPGPQVTNEDVARVFAAASSNAITVADVDASSLQLSLSASSGALTLTVKTGLTFQAGDGTADGSMTFTGTIANVNAALNGLSYLPAANYTGAAVITVLTSDLGAAGTGGTLTDEDTIAVTVTQVNDPPSAINDALTVAEDSPPTSVAVLANDSALPDTGESLSITAVTSPTNGTAAIEGSQITYQPATNYRGADSFSYTISDGNGGTSSATVAVTVTSVNDSPTAAADSFSVLQSSLSNTLSVLSNDSSAPDSGETLTIIGVTTPSNGTASIINGGAALSYTPTTGYSGADSFSYTISDGNSGTATAAVAITVTAVNTRPVNTLPAPQTAVEDTPLFFSSAAGNAITVADSNHSSLTVQIGVTNGTFTLGSTTGLTVTGNGTANVTLSGPITTINTGLNNSRYNASLHYNGGAALTIVSSDTSGENDLDTLTLTVASFNDPPINTVPTGVQTATEDLPRTFSTISVTDADVGASALSVVLTANNGTLLTLSTASGLTFTSGDGLADATMAFTGMLPAINTALNGLSITSPANFLGPSTLVITTNDLGNTGAGVAGEDSDTINLTWGSVNDPPLNSVPGDQVTLEETPVAFSSAGGAITVSDADIGGGFMRVTFSSSNGTVSLGNPGLVTFTTGDGTADVTMTFSGTLSAVNSALDGATFTPALNFVGNAVVTVLSNDQGNTGGAAQTDTDTIAVAVLPVNDAPVNNVPIAQTTNEEIARIFSTTNGNAITVGDVDATSLQVTLSAESGSVSLGGTTALSFLSGDGTADVSMTFTAAVAAINTALAGARFTPAPNFNGIGRVTIVTNDQGMTGAGGARFDEDVIEINVGSVNDAPDAVADAFTLSEDAAPQALTVLANDSSAPDSGETLTITIVTAPQHGTASTDGTTVTYQPAANYGGADSFMYTISDGNGLTDAAAVSITVTDVNDAPDAADDALTVAEGAIGHALSVLANDTAAPDSGETLTITAFSDPAHGTLEIADAGAGLSYTPTFAYFGADSFTYTISDGNGGTDTATVTLDVTSVDTEPAPVADVLSVDEDSAGGTVDVLANDTGLSDLPIVVTIMTQPAHGTASVLVDNTIEYVPEADYSGADAIAYTVTDVDGDTANGNVVVTVVAVDDLPHATADTATTEEDTEVDIEVLANDTELVDVPVEVSIESEPQHGEATVNDDGTVTYTPDADYHGEDEFEYAVTDATGSVEIALVSVTVTPVNDPPVAVADTGTAEPGVAVVIDVLDNDTDVDGDELSIDEVGDSELGSTIAIEDGTLRYTPPAGVVDAMETFTYTVIDGAGGSATGTVVVSVGLDSDGDGLTDADEAQLGTDPDSADTDGDLIPDGLEVATTNTDVLDGDSDDDGLLDGNEDADRDGTVDDSETDPNDADTDDDGLQDGTESGLSAPQGPDTDLEVFVPDEDPESTTDPREADTDGDGASDGEEDADGNGDVGLNEADPNDPDDEGMARPPQGGMNGGGDGGTGGSPDAGCEDECEPDGGDNQPPSVIPAKEEGGCRAAGSGGASGDSLWLALACALLWLRRRSR